MLILDENDNPVNIYFFEATEQLLANKYVEENDTILELGARYGSVSCISNFKLKNKTNHVVVEPDERVWNALEKNKQLNNCEFNIVKGFVANKKMALTNVNDCFGYGTSSVEDNTSNINSYTLNEIKQKYNIKYFSFLIADCEGYLGEFLNTYPELYDEMNKIMFERDGNDKSIYVEIVNKLYSKGFDCCFDTGSHAVFIKRK